MGNLEYSFDNILKSYIDIGIQLPDHQLNLISSNKNMLKTYIRKRVVAVKKTNKLLSDKELELLKKFDKKSYDDYMNYLSNLKELDLNDNQLTSIPESIGNLTKLERLYLQNNQLTSLEGIENLTNLKVLKLSNNELTSLEGIKNLTNLEVLKLSNNKLTSLKGIENLTNLEVLGLQNNPISGSEKARVKKIFGDKVEFFV